MQRVSIILVCLSLASCMTLPPTTSFNAPTNAQGPVEANAWLARVEITDIELVSQESRAQVENSLANNLLRFLRDGKYFRQIELLPGTPKPEDFVLRFVFDRYRKERHWKVFVNSDASDLAASLIVTHSDGTLVKGVRASVMEEHLVDSLSPEDALPSGMKGRTQLVEDLLRQALWPPKANP